MEVLCPTYNLNYYDFPVVVQLGFKILLSSSILIDFCTIIQWGIEQRQYHNDFERRNLKNKEKKVWVTKIYILVLDCVDQGIIVVVHLGEA